MNRVSLSFLVDTMDKRRGGCAPNIAYTLALLGERPLLMATAGEDFGEYRAVARGGRRRHVARRSRSPASSARRSSAAPTRTTTRSPRSTPARWPTPAQLSFRDRRATAGWRSSRRTIPARWCSTPRSAARSASASSSIRASSARGCRATSCATASSARRIVIVQRLRARAAAAEDRPRARPTSSTQREALIVTRGEHGSSVITRDGRDRRRRRSRRTASSIRPASATRSAAG